MKQLPQTVTKSIFTYELTARTEKVAIYAQRISENGKLVGHEVFIIPKYQDREIHGTVVPAHEGFPGDNAFGVAAWSVGRDIVHAMRRFSDVCELVDRRALTHA